MATVSSDSTNSPTQANGTRRNRGGTSSGGFYVYTPHTLLLMVGIIGAIIALIFAAFMFCLCPSNRKVRIVITWIWAIGGAISVGCMLGFYAFGAWRFQVYQIDQKIRNFHPLFCDQVSFNMTEKSNYYLVNGQPNQAPGFKYETYQKFNTYLASNTFTQVNTYLLKGSSINATLTLSYSVGKPSFILIKGSNNFNKWRSNVNSNNDFVLKRALTSYKNTIQITIKDDDEYYFVLLTERYFDAQFSEVQYALKLTYHDFDLKSIRCSNTTLCTISIPLDMNVQVYVKGVTKSIVASSVSKCHSRWWIYLLLIAMGAISLGMLISMLIWRFCKDCDHIFKEKNSSSNATPTSFSNPNHVTPSLPRTQVQDTLPPSYNSVMSANVGNFQSNYNVEYGGFNELNKPAGRSNVRLPPPSCNDTVQHV